MIKWLTALETAQRPKLLFKLRVLCIEALGTGVGD